MTTVPFNGISIAPSQILGGMSKGVKQGGVVHVPPAFYSLLKSAATQREMAALLQSFKFIDLDPHEPQHDAQWWSDTAQILAAQLADARRHPEHEDER